MGVHFVKQGECLSSIAHFYGFDDWRTIYRHSENRAFREKRPDPNLIYPEDELYIPEPDLKQFDCMTERLHVFEVDLNPTYLRVRVQNQFKKPIANANYILELGSTTIKDKTDKHGWIKKEIRANHEFGKLIVSPQPGHPEADLVWKIKLGHLDPIDTTSGIKGRLANLGYECGEINSEKDVLYEIAVRNFQSDNDLMVDGDVGEKTRTKLERNHRV